MVVKGFGAEEREEERLSRVVGKWRSRTERTWQRGTLNGAFQGATLIILRTAIVGVAILLWWQGAAKAGDITLVLTSFFVLQGYLRDVGQYVRNLQRAVNDMEELVDVHHQPFSIADRPEARAHTIEAGRVEFDHVTFHYGKHMTALYDDFSVTIPAGQRVGLVGYSGSGKTTFVKLIQRLYDVTGGRILVDGVDIRDFTQASLRGQIAIVQQEPILFHRSLADNIAYSRPGASRAEVIEAAKLASAHEFIETLPKGYETMVGERGVKLSGGERQRVAIARAFLADAPILILDEATSSLDSESEVLIQRAMERLMVGRTTIVIAHRLSTVRALDRLLVFDKGRIIEEGARTDARPRGGMMTDWSNLLAPSLDEFEALAVAALESLPQPFRDLTRDVTCMVAEFPEEEVLDELGIESEFDLMGLFHGTGLPQQGGHVRTGQMPNHIVLYRRPILDYWAEHEETLGAIVTHVLIHEMGHHFGFSDEDMEAMEDAAAKGSLE
jgi:ABC-type multidrug transport system fused ATPase/permease subunit/predicted Zn-dependent protease with MMP-like domain